MEDEAVVVAVAAVGGEVLNRPRALVSVELQVDVPEGGVEGLGERAEKGSKVHE